MYDLARPLVGIIQKFFEDPKNIKEFEEWKRTKKAEKEIYQNYAKLA